MKIKITVTLCVIVIFTSHLLGQTNSDIYIIGTSISPVERCTGFVKVSAPIKYYHETPSISFVISSVEKDYEVWFNYHNFKVQELKKLGKNVADNNRAIIDRPISDLNNFRIIDAEEFMRTKTKSQVWDWILQNENKKIYVIDRNDFYKSSPSLSTNDRMKLIETQVWSGNIPDDVLNPR